MADARIIDGKAIAAQLRERVAAAAAALRDEHGIVPGLAAVLVGDDAASQVYVRSKARACAAAGLASFEFRLSTDAGLSAILELVTTLNADERVDGILVQLPLPAEIEPQSVIATIDPAKDVDGFHPVNVGRLWSGDPGLVPCTPQGCLILLRTVHDDLSGAEAVVLGRSNLVGKPMAALLLAADCTVTTVHSKSREAAAICRRADILVAAIGRAGMVTRDFVRAGATVIDVGMNRVSEAAEFKRLFADNPKREETFRLRGAVLVGDVHPEVAEVAGAITPVPGGVGPLTIAMLMSNTIKAAKMRRGGIGSGLARPA